MTSTQIRSRTAIAALAALAVAAAPLVGASAAYAAGPYDDRVVLSQGHADAFYIQKDAAGEPELVLHSDEFGNHPADHFLIQGKPSVATRTAGAAVAGVLGVAAGTEYYLLPQTNQTGQVFLGFGYNTTDYPANSITVTHTISNFQGAGTLALWQNSEDGPLEFVNSSKDDWSFSSLANHEHVNWGFTAQGAYTFDVTSTFTDGGVEKTAGPETYTFFIGEELPQDEDPTDPGQTVLSVTGAAAHYHTGEVAVVSAVQSPEPVSDHFHWFTRATPADEWTVVSGAFGERYGFIVMAEHQLKAVLYDHDHAVIAESEPVDIRIDDHGNTPGTGPEISVALPEAEGALVISVSAEGQTSRLGDLALNPAADRYVSTGSITGITVTDTRSGDLGWAASGRVRGLVTIDGDALDGTFLGWTPTVVSSTAGQTVTAGPVVAPGFAEGNGIKGWNVLGSAPAGASRGTAVLGADIRIEAPTTTAVGDYTGTVLITVI